MAFTVTKVFDMSVGAKKATTFKVTADAATQTIEASTLGMKYIDFFHTGRISACTNINIHANLDVSGVASNGALGISGAVSGDILFITVYGR